MSADPSSTVTGSNANNGSGILISNFSEREKPPNNNLNSSNSGNNVISNQSSSSRPTMSVGGAGGGGTTLQQQQDEKLFKMAPEAVDPAILSRGSLSRRRYSRTALLLLRDNSLSRSRPDCCKDPRLVSLAVWKRSETPKNSNHNNGTHSGNNNNMGPGSGRIISSGGGLSGNSSSNQQKNLIDHRSISSSHLMPAFVKRRIVTATCINTINNNSNSNNGNNNSNNNAQNDPKERLRKDQEPLILLSPQRRSINMGCQIPSSGSHNDRDISSSVRERRIGSGRLPPRDVNWDYRPDKDSATTETEYGGGNSGSYRSNNMNSYRDHRSSGGGGGGGGGNNIGNNSNSNNDRNEYRDRYERRSFGREYERDNRGDNSNYVRRFITDLANQNSNNGGGSGNNDRDHHRRRQYSESRTDEPEWFSGGPTSQHDTIELRGFDETEDYMSGSGCGRKSSYKSTTCYKPGGNRAVGGGGGGVGGSGNVGDAGERGGRSTGNTNNDQQQSANIITRNNQNENQPNQNDIQDLSISDDTQSTIVTNSNSPPPARSTPTKHTNDSNNNSNEDKSVVGSDDDLLSQHHQSSSSSSNNHDSGSGSNDKHVEFNFDDFLKLDPLNDILTGDANIRGGESGSSRFSQWFQRTSPNHMKLSNTGDSRRSSLHEELNNMLNEQNPNNRQENTGNDTEKYFAPISPASSSNQPTNTLLEFLQRGKFINAQSASTDSSNSLSITTGNSNIGNQGHGGVVGGGGVGMISSFNAMLDKQMNDGHLQQQQQQQQQQHHHHIAAQVAAAANRQKLMTNNVSAGMIPSVEELEARMRKNELGSGNNSSNNNASSSGGGGGGGGNSNGNPFGHILANNLHARIGGTGGGGNGTDGSTPQPQDMEAFKKLLEQIAPIGKSLSNVNPMITLQQQQQQAMVLQQVINRTKQDDLKKMFQQQQHRNQQQMLQKISQTNGQFRNEIAKRPEAQALIQGLARGEITQNTLMQHLTSSMTSPNYRDAIITVLHYLNTSSRVNSPSNCPPQLLSPTLIVHPQQQQNQQQQQSQSQQQQQQHQQQQQQTGAVSTLPQPANPPGSLLKPGGAASGGVVGGGCVNIITPGTNLNAINPNNAGQSSAIAAAVAAAAAVGSQTPQTNDVTLQTHILFQQHQTKQLRLSPLPNGIPQRIPSPRELQYHTQTIMQSALIKKKLEEQQENYRRRQEIQKQQQQGSNLGVVGVVGPGQMSSIPVSGNSTVCVGGGGSNGTVVGPGGGNANGNNIGPGACINNAIVPASGANNDDSTTIQSINYANAAAAAGVQIASHSSPSPAKQSQINSPTPLAFTPTSVLRKMTAEKDTFLTSTVAANTAAAAALENVKNMTAVANKTGGMQPLHVPNSHQRTTPPSMSQPRMILGGGSAVQQQQQQQQQQQHTQSQQSIIGPGGSQPISPQSASLQQALRNNSMKWNSMNLNQMPLNKPMGRPILKGGPTPSTQQTPPMITPQMSFASKIEYQQIQQHQQQQLQQRNKTAQQTSLILSHLQHQQQQQQQQQQMQHAYRQQRAMRGQYPMQYQMMPPNSSPNAGGTTNTQPGAGPQCDAPQTATGNNTSSGPGIINYQRDGGLSPTSNQLARWFSPELLAQASAGKLPSLNMGQALSLEEFERSIQHSSATVHN